MRKKGKKRDAYNMQRLSTLQMSSSSSSGEESYENYRRPVGARPQQAAPHHDAGTPPPPPPTLPPPPPRRNIATTEQIEVRMFGMPPPYTRDPPERCTVCGIGGERANFQRGACCPSKICMKCLLEQVRLKKGNKILIPKNIECHECHNVVENPLYVSDEEIIRYWPLWTQD